MLEPQADYTPPADIEPDNTPALAPTDNLRETELFLSLFGDTHVFQTFDDNKEPDAVKDKTLTRTFTGTFAQHKDALLALNQRGAGIFFTVNTTDGTGSRKKENIITPTAIWQDDDNPERVVRLPAIDPNVVIETSPGKFHRYWLIDEADRPDVDLEQWDRVQKNMTVKYDSDPNANDRSRVMRVPGFLHVKYRDTPFMSRIVIPDKSTSPYKWSELLEHIGELDENSNENIHTAALTTKEMPEHPAPVPAFARQKNNSGILKSASVDHYTHDLPRLISAIEAYVVSPERNEWLIFTRATAAAMVAVPVGVGIDAEADREAIRNAWVAQCKNVEGYNEVGNEAKLDELIKDAIQGTNDTPAKHIYKFAGDECGWVYKGGNALVVSQDKAIPPGAYTPSAIMEMFNARYFALTQGDDDLVYEVKSDGAVRAFKTTSFYSNTASHHVKIDENGKSSERHAGRWWIGSVGCRRFKDVIFDPEQSHGAIEQGCYAGYYNTWRGFDMLPTPWTDADNENPEMMRRFDLLIKHIFEIICSSNREHFEYLVKLFAYRLQYPDRHIKTAVILLSDREGAGKSMMTDWLIKMIGVNHTARVSNSKMLVGNFNGHLDEKLLVVSEEAVWSGDKAASDALKSLITEDTLMVEEKYKTAKAVKNRLMLIANTNHTHAAHAGRDARRYLMLEVSDHKVSDTEYFTALAGQADNGGIEAFMGFLLSVNLTGFKHRLVPHTKMLEEQKRMSAGSSIEWLYECAEAGYLLPTEDGLTPHTNALGETYANTYLGEQYKKWCLGERKYKPESTYILAKRFNSLGITKTRSSEMINRRRPEVRIIPEGDVLVTMLKKQGW